jgi:hypothetical protein
MALGYNVLDMLGGGSVMMAPTAVFIALLGLAVAWFGATASLSDDVNDATGAAGNASSTSRVVFSAIWSALSSNGMLAAMFWSSVVGSLLYVVSQSVALLQRSFAKRFYRSITISSKDENYRPVLEFLSQHCVPDDPALMVSTARRKRQTFKEWRDEAMGVSARKLPDLDFLPSNSSGTAHVFLYKGQRFLMQRSAGQTITTGWDRKPLDLETITISSW